MVKMKSERLRVNYLPMRAKNIRSKRCGAMNAYDEERENKRLREILQAAVNKEKAPESLREKLRRMIRE